MTIVGWGQIAIIIAGYLIAILYQTHHLDSRIDDLRSEMGSRFSAVDKRFDDLKDWIRSEFQRVEERIDRVEHSVQRP